MDNILTQILYAFSGFFFGIVGIRYSTVGFITIIGTWKQEGFAKIFSPKCIIYLLAILVGAFIFPILLSSRSQLASFIYYIVFIFYGSKNYRIYDNSHK